MTNAAIIVPEGDHVLVTDEGIELLGEYGQLVHAECNCGSRIELRVCADAPIADAECDGLIDGYLTELGWAVDPVRSSSDVCPACTPAAGAPR